MLYKTFFLICVSTLCVSLNAFALDDLIGELDGVDLLLDDSPRLIFHAPMDGFTEGVTARYRINSAGTPDDELSFEPGVRGLAVRCERYHVAYPVADIMNPERGSLSFWFKWDTDSEYRHRAQFQGLAGMVNGNLSFPLSDFNTGTDDWDNWVVTWDYSRNTAELFRDGEHVRATGMNEPFHEGLLRLGHGVPGLLDEVAVFANIITPEQIKEHIKRIKDGREPWDGVADLEPEHARYPLAINTVGVKRSPPPERVDWSLDAGPERGARRRYSLDGLWRVQPIATRYKLPPKPGEINTARFELHPDYNPDPLNWGYTIVPGGWRASFGKGAVLDEHAEQSLEQWNNVDLPLYPSAWLERDFQLPAVSGGEGVFLVCEDTYDGCDFYINDIYLGHARRRTVFDITDHVVSGAQNRLTVLAGKPYGSFSMIVEGKVHTSPSGIRGAVFLEMRPSRLVNVAEVFAMPSHREKQLGVEFLAANREGVTGELSVGCEIEDISAGRIIDLGSATCVLTGLEKERLVVHFDWSDPVLWFPDDPKLLNMSLVFRKDGKLLDQSWPIRFGFREVWTEGGDMMMNGVPFRLKGSGNGWESRGSNVVSLINHLRARGMNSAIGWFIGGTPQPTLGEALNVADEMGFLSAFTIYPQMHGSEEVRERSMRAVLNNFRNHPSVYGYVIGISPYCIGPENDPISLGRSIEDADTEDELYKSNVDAFKQLKAVDPMRPAGFYTRGVVGDFRSAMQYIGYGTPIQTREELFSYWARKKPAPFIGTEMDMSLYLFAWLWQKGGFSNEDYASGNGTIPLATEHAARYWGNNAYTNETFEWVRAINEQYTNPSARYPMREHINLQKLTALTVKHTCRSWRTYGVSFQALNAILNHAHLKDGDPANDPWLLGDQAFAANNMDFLAYIAGESGNFVAKDHAFYSGELVKKQIVFINDYFRPKKVVAEWNVLESGSGRMLDTYNETLELEGGEIRKHPFEFTAPDVHEKTVFTIELSAKMEDHLQTDEFEIEVFPRPASPDTGNARFAILDENGDGARLLELAGVEHRKIDTASDWVSGLDADEILVIGRKSLPDEETQTRLMEKTRTGLRIICFEQWTTNVFGLRNDDPNTRHVFISAFDHPLVEGLSDEDFRNWRGASDILECYPDYREGFEYGRLDHYNAKGFFGQVEFSQWSSQGTVTAFHFEKPQTGNFVPVLSSGFDMLYSPLLDLSLGKGKMLICALDVSNRYGTDPVATLVVNRILEYMAEAQAPETRVMAVWGDPYWEAAIDDLGRSREKIEDFGQLDKFRALLIGLGEYPARAAILTHEEKVEQAAGKIRGLTIEPEPEQSVLGDDLLAEFEIGVDDREWETSAVKKRLSELRANRRELAGFIEDGGTVIVPFVPDTECLDWLPFNVKLEEQDVFLGKPAGVGAFAGLTYSDFFFREILTLPVITEIPADGRMDSGGFVAFVPYGKGQVVLCQLYPAYFNDVWQRTKVLRIFSGLLRECGVEWTGLTESLGGDLEGIWYYDSALDFNPDMHRSW